MSRTKFDDDCVGCRPVAINLQTGKPLPDDHPMMRSLARVWQKMGPLHRSAFHRVTCLSSTNPLDQMLAREYITKVQAAAMAEEKPDGHQAQ